MLDFLIGFFFVLPIGIAVWACALMLLVMLYTIATDKL